MRDNFFAELKRRNVVRMAGLYLVGAWLLTQVASTVLPMFGAPDWLPRSIVLLLVIGFVPALIFSWVFELTPQGLKRDEEVAPEQSIGPQTGRRMDRMIIVVLLLALGYFAFDKFVLTPRRVTRETGSQTSSLPGHADINPKSIAVLPFENLSDEKANAYLTEGIQDEILTKLAGITDLKVISRTSTAKYRSKPENLKTVSEELGVASVLEGTVQKSGDKVRINVQLVDARADSHLWAKSYDREAKDIFAVESEISQEVADVLQARLSPAEAGSLATAPTKDAEAYDLFLKGEYAEREAESALKPAVFENAARFYLQGFERDPQFALALARLANNRVQRHWFVAKASDTELAEIKKIADQALALAPNLPEARMALGNFYYYGQREYEKALSEYGRVLELRPNDVQAQEQVAFIYRRQGRWQLALAEMARCEARDPRNVILIGNMGTTYLNLRMWKDAIRVGSHARALDPNNVVGMRAVFCAYVNGFEDLNEAKRVWATFPPGTTLSNPSQTGNAATIIGDGTYLYTVDRDFTSALKAWEKETSNPDEERSQLAARVTIHVLAGDATEAQTEIAKVLTLVEARLSAQPDDTHALNQLSWIYLALHRDAEAVRVAQKAADLLPVAKDALAGPAVLAGLAEIQARAGETTAAVGTLRLLLSIPAGICVSLQRIKIDPVWDPIRNDPGFQQLLTGTQKIGP
jgi:TolB-like protein/cytochrome c-type biogenesis protein CcmH/NrfG